MMTDRLVILWAASRPASAAETRLTSELAGPAGADVRIIAISALAREIVPALVLGPVIVIVGTRRDAATALSLGADEVVRVARSVSLRRSTMESAIERALARSRGRTAPMAERAATEACPGLSLLLRVLERDLGRPPDAAAVKCNELAEELGRVVAIADRLMRRVQVRAVGDELKGWFSEVKDYARATLKAEALATALQDEVQRVGAVVKLLGDLSAASPNAETDLASFLPYLADFLRSDIAPDFMIEVITEGSCVVRVPRQTLACIVCAAVEIALDNILSRARAGRLTLRASKMDGALVLEVADDGALGSTDLRPSIIDPFVANTRTTRLRQIRERARAIGGELIADGDETGNSVSIYIPVQSGATTGPLLEEQGTMAAHRGQ